jgi:hypothetical protein
MNSKPLVRVIKKGARETAEVEAKAGFLLDQNRWSTAVRSWVNEFQQERRSASRPAFDSLFRDPLPGEGGREAERV